MHYSLTPRDRRNLQHSVRVMHQMFLKTGAALVMPVYDAFRTWRRGRDGEEGLEEYLKVGARAHFDDACMDRSV